LARASLDAIHQNPHPLSEQLAGPLPQQAAQAAALAVLNGSASITAGNNGQQQQRQFQLAPSTVNNAAGNIPRISKDYGELPRWSDSSTSWRVSSSPDDRRSFDYVGSMSLSNMSNRPSIDYNNNSSTHNGSVGGNGGSYMTNAFANNNGQPQQGRSAGSPLESPGSSRFPSGACTPKEQYNHNQQHHGNGNSSGHGGQGYYAEQSNGNGGGNNQRGSYSDLRSSSSSPGAQLPSREISTTSSNGGGGAPSEADLAQSLATLKIALTQRQVASAAAGSNHEIVISTLHQILRDAVSSQNNSNNSNTVVGGDDN